MIKEHRRSSRRRTAPKRFEDEKFVCGSVDRYQHSYDGSFKEGQSEKENYYNSSRGRKWCELRRVTPAGRIIFYHKDFPESLLEFSSIWRDMGLVLPGALVSRVGEFLNIKNIDSKLIEADDEFIVGDEDEEFVELVESEDEEFNSGDEETDDGEEWDSEAEDSEEEASEEEEDIPTHDGWNHRWGCPPIKSPKNNKK